MYLAIITLYKVIIAGALNFKVAVSPFLNVYMEVISAIAEKSKLNFKEHKRICDSVWWNTFLKKDIKFVTDLIE